MATRDRSQRGQAHIAPGALPTLQPGDQVRLFARGLDWPLGTHNVVVEGTLDVSYCHLAAKLYKEDSGRELISDGFSIFAVGERDQGGTLNIVRRFTALRQLIEIDPPDEDATLLFLGLVDDDSHGRHAVKLLTAAGFTEFRNVVKLARVIPRKTHNPPELRKHVGEANEKWRSLGKCEIEDLVSAELLDAFCADAPGAIIGSPIVVEGEHHYEWRDHEKPKLFRYVQDYAMAKDVERLVELLRSLRFLLGLDPDGSAA